MAILVETLPSGTTRNVSCRAARHWMPAWWDRKGRIFFSLFFFSFCNLPITTSSTGLTHARSQLVGGCSRYFLPYLNKKQRLLFLKWRRHLWLYDQQVGRSMVSLGSHKSTFCNAFLIIEQLGYNGVRIGNWNCWWFLEISRNWFLSENVTKV